MSKRGATSGAPKERWHYGRVVAIGTFFVAVIMCVLPVSATGSTDSCGTAIGAALMKPGPSNGVNVTRAQLCHPLGIGRLHDAAALLIGGLVLSAAVGYFAQPPEQAASG